MPIQACQLSRHFAVLRHHEDHADHRDDRSVYRAEEQKTKNIPTAIPNAVPKPGAIATAP